MRNLEEKMSKLQWVSWRHTVPVFSSPDWCLVRRSIEIQCVWTLFSHFSGRCGSTTVTELYSRHCRSQNIHHSGKNSHAHEKWPQCLLLSPWQLLTYCRGLEFSDRLVNDESCILLQQGSSFIWDVFMVCEVTAWIGTQFLSTAEYKWSTVWFCNSILLLFSNHL